MVDALIKENRQLKRKLEKLAASGITSSRGRQANPLITGIARLERKVKAALASTPTTSTRRSSRTTVSSATRRTRKPVSPEVAEKRRQALAKAREVRAAKLAAAASDTGTDAT